MVKNPPAMQEMQVQSLGQEDPLEEEMATHSSILAWRIPWTEEPGGLQSMGSQRVKNDLVSKHTCWYTEIQLVSHTAVTTSNVAKFTSVLIICLLFSTNKSHHLEKKRQLISPFLVIVLFSFFPNHCTLARTSKIMMNRSCDN